MLQTAGLLPRVSLSSRFAVQVLKIKTKAYIPDFKQAFEHFCIHTGGRGVIEEIEKQLQLTEAQTRPSKEALYRYGNTSSSSIYYELSCEAARSLTSVCSHCLWMREIFLLIQALM